MTLSVADVTVTSSGDDSPSHVSVMVKIVTIGFGNRLTNNV